MEQELMLYLTEASGHILTVVGLAALPLITSFIFRAGKLRNITPENMEEKVGDLCAETIRLSIDDQIHALLKAYCQLDPNFIMPTFRKLRQVFDLVHQDSESIDFLLSCLKSLTEFGLQSPEFHQVRILLSQ